MSATTAIAKAKDATPALAAYSLNKPEELAGLAELLQYHIQHHRLFTDIQGKKYVNVEGWAFAGALLGIVPIVEKVEDTSTHQPRIFKGYQGKPDTTVHHTEFRATVSLLDLRSEKTIGRGIASCSNFESKKRGFDPYAVESMAQTRATGKAFRLLLAWIMQAGGYATTPAEEMPDAEPETGAAVVVEQTDPALLELQWRTSLESATSTAELKEIWAKVPKPLATVLLPVKDEQKRFIDETVAADAAGMTVEQYRQQPVPND